MDSVIPGGSNASKPSSPGLQAEQSQGESEERFRNLIHTLPAALYVTDLYGRITLYNDIAAEMWGRRPEIGKERWCGSWRIFKPNGEPLPHDQCPMAITLREGRPVHGEELVVERPDGTRAVVLPHPEPLLNSSGEMIGAINMLVDITDRKQSEEALRSSEQSFRAIFSQAAVGIAVVELDGRFRDVNERLCEMLGRTATEFRTLTCADVTHPDDWQGNFRMLDRVGEGFLPEFSIEKRFLRKDGTVLWVNVAVSPLLDADGKPERLVAIIEDINSRKAAEDQIQDLNRSLEARVVDRTAQLEAFCYSIAHDLRQHIRGVSLNAHLVKDQIPSLDPEISGSLTRLVGAAKHMDRLVTDLLSYARSSHQEMRTDEVDLTEVARQVAGRLRMVYPDAEFRVEKGLETVGDAASLGVVIQNLMENACKYAASERVAVVEVGRTNGSFHVRDNGTGFDMKYVDQLFEPFQRLHRHSDIPGTGLGLASVKQIVEKHGGKVWAESQVGMGSTFFFKLK